MKNMNKLRILLLAILVITLKTGMTQNVRIDYKNGQIIAKYLVTEEMNFVIDTVPFFSVLWNGSSVVSDDGSIRFSADSNYFVCDTTLAGNCRRDTLVRNAVKLVVTLVNTSKDTIETENFVPFSQTDDKIYITGIGPWDLARTKLFRPGKEPVGVILPDNAWEMGYCSVGLKDGRSLCAIARRKEVTGGKKHRYITQIYPGGRINYDVYISEFTGDWQNGLKRMFGERYLYDLTDFNDSLYRRQDLSWIREKYLMVLQFAWNHDFYDQAMGGYGFESILKTGKELCGGYDVFGIWPTWPTLGVDERNQWDLYRDMPEGLSGLKKLSQYAKSNGTYFFLSYNPWDQSTRKEDQYKGMARLIEASDADGVVLDCSGSSSYQLQHSADSIKSGVIMYSEGMAVPKDMPGIISGRVHDAIYMPPPLNLNKLIKPDFAIFRVCQLSQGRIHREVAISLFNGYGVELNTFAPGRPDWIEDEMKYLGRAVRILRENSKAFNSFDWIPLIPTTTDKIWVNKFPLKTKTVYTVFSLLPEGFSGPLFEAEAGVSKHYVSIWNHEELIVTKSGGISWVPATISSFDKSWLGTRREGNVDCIALFENIIGVRKSNDTLYIDCKQGDSVKVWAGNPGYDKKPAVFGKGKVRMSLHERFGRYEGKIVIQLFAGNELVDERIVEKQPGLPVLISTVKKTPAAASAPEGMVEVPAGSFVMKVGSEDNFVPYPDYDTVHPVQMKRFFIDKYPVTNNQFYEFIESTGYKPSDTVNYLKHWEQGKYPKGKKNHPVVYVSHEDATAYSAWAGKRLPTEAEWQYAAQGSDGRLYPWGNDPDSTRYNKGSQEPSSVVQFPEGTSPFGALDMVGNVWQLMSDIYDNGSYYYIIMRGGSYYNPTSSWWYVKGGAQPLNRTQMLLRVSPGFERNATVGFRCVKDAE
jgi:formylglycine-generating enzyme required for sulfatase activity